MIKIIDYIHNFSLAILTIIRKLKYFYYCKHVYFTEYLPVTHIHHLLAFLLIFSVCNLKLLR